MKQIILLLVTAGMFAGCKKDSSNPTNPGNVSNNNPTKTPKDLITTTWIIESCIDNKPGVSDPNLLLECQKDDNWIFKTDGTYELDAGAVKCNPSDPQKETGTWNIDSYPLLIIKDHTNIAAFSDTIKLTQLDETTLKYSQPYDNDGNTFTSIWKKK